jgi:hypothetical protein
MAEDVSDSRQLAKTIEQLIDAQPNDQRLRDHLEGLTRNTLFPGLTWFWGPRLYQRNRVIFRPLMLEHFSNWMVLKSGRWQRVEWADHAVALERWLEAARANRDTRLVRQLLRWKFAGKGWQIDWDAWRAALLADFKAAPTAAARAIVLDEYGDWFQLDELTAAALYRLDPTSVDFVLQHLPRFFWTENRREMWSNIANLARNRGDDRLYFALYRALMPVDRWSVEVLALADAIDHDGALCMELERRHPEGYGLKLVPTVIALLKKRGRDVIPYVRAKLGELVGGWRGEGAEELITLAEKNGWWDLWAATLRTNRDSKLYRKAIADLLDNKSVGEEDRVERLHALAGVSREWNWPGLGLATLHSLEDDLATKLYARYPDLVRGPFLPQVTPRWWQGYPTLLAAAQKAGDGELVDIIASRYAVRVAHRYSRHKETDAQLEAAKALAGYYQAIRDRDPQGFALRASNVLTHIPAYATYDYQELLRSNDLARLLFVRSFDAFLTVPRAVRDLVEGSSIYVQMLAYRVLALDSERARRLAADNLDILIGTLLRPIHRKTRLPAFGALLNAARGDLDAAQKILSRAHDALRLPDKRYPKAELVGLIGQILNAQPSLRQPAEQPVIYGLEGRAA